MSSTDLPSAAESIAELDTLRQRVRADQNRYAVTTPLAVFGAVLVVGGAFTSSNLPLFPSVVLNALALPAFVITGAILSYKSRKHGLNLNSRHYLMAGLVVVLAFLVGMWILPGLAAAVALVGIGIVERRWSIALTGALIGALGLGSLVGWPYVPLVNAGLLPDSFDFGAEGFFFVAAGIGFLVAALVVYLRSRRSV